MEKKLQTKIARYLRAKGCYVLVVQPQAGIPQACPDIIALCDGGGWVALEVKANEKSRFQPLQKITIAKLDDMYYARVVHENNWEEIKKELETLLQESSHRR